ncbi:MAG: transposase [Acidobacteria bacterium]|nr:transposase [Acidobacteriota bacterium]
MGSIWFDEECLAAWKNQDRTGKKGHPQEYADTA